MDSTTERKESESSDDDDDSDGWEEVPIPPLYTDNSDGALQDRLSSIPEEGLVIVVPKDGMELQKGRKKNDAGSILRREANRWRRGVQEDIHKVHLLCFISQALMYNRTLRSESVLAAALSTLPSKQAYPPKNLDLNYVEKFMKWFRVQFSVDTSSMENACAIMVPNDLEQALMSQLQSYKARNHNYLVCIFIIILRALGVQVRLIYSLNAIPVKPHSDDLLIDPALQAKRRMSEVAKLTKQDSKKKKVNGRRKMNDTKKEEDSGPSTIPIQNSSSGERQPKPKIGITTKTRNTRRETGVHNDTDDSKNNHNLQNSKTKKAGQPRKRPPVIDSNSEDSDYEPSSSKKTRCTNFRKETNKLKAVESKSTLASIKTDDPIDAQIVASSVCRCNICDRLVIRERYHCGICDGGDFDLCSKCYQRLSHEHKMEHIIDEQSETAQSDDGANKKEVHNIWPEVYLEEEERWISVDLSTGSVLCDSILASKAEAPMTYVLAFGNEGYVKDVTRRYASQWLTRTQKLRVNPSWWSETLRPFRGTVTKRDKEEDEFLDQQILNQPVPKSISELKGHPLYCLRRHLLKFETIYPAEPIPVGFIKDEPIYSRDAVKTLHTKEVWLKEAKVVRIGEQPYKIVKSRPKYDKRSGQVIKDLPADLFGDWQVEDFMPPVAVNGKVPRNDFGNVELFKERMLPKGTVHLRVPALNRVARKLDIDCARAVVGFEYHSGNCAPQFDGFVVCEEFKEILLDAWNQDQDAAAKRQAEKRKQRAYKNWARLIRCAMIRKRLIREGHTFDNSERELESSSSKSEVLSVGSPLTVETRPSSSDIQLHKSEPPRSQNEAKRQKVDKAPASKRSSNSKKRQSKRELQANPSKSKKSDNKTSTLNSKLRKT